MAHLWRWPGKASALPQDERREGAEVDGLGRMGDFAGIRRAALEYPQAVGVCVSRRAGGLGSLTVGHSDELELRAPGRTRPPAREISKVGLVLTLVGAVGANVMLLVDGASRCALISE